MHDFTFVLAKQIGNARHDYVVARFKSSQGSAVWAVRNLVERRLYRSNSANGARGACSRRLEYRARSVVGKKRTLAWGSNFKGGVGKCAILSRRVFCDSPLRGVPVSYTHLTLPTTSRVGGSGGRWPPPSSPRIGPNSSPSSAGAPSPAPQPSASK